MIQYADIQDFAVLKEHDKTHHLADSGMQTGRLINLIGFPRQFQIHYIVYCHNSAVIIDCRINTFKKFFSV